MSLPAMLARAAAHLDAELDVDLRGAMAIGSVSEVSPGSSAKADRARPGAGAQGRTAASARGKASRRKGAKGQSEFADILRDHDWVVDQITAGIASADLIATDPAGKTWAVEVKNCASILPAHLKQAMEQGEKRRLPWMLASKIAGTSSWLVQRKGRTPVVWSAKENPASTALQGLGGVQPSRVG